MNLILLLAIVLKKNQENKIIKIKIILIHFMSCGGVECGGFKISQFIFYSQFFF